MITFRMSNLKNHALVNLTDGTRRELEKEASRMQVCYEGVSRQYYPPRTIINEKAFETFQHQSEDSCLGAWEPKIPWTMASSYKLTKWFRAASVNYRSKY